MQMSYLVNSLVQNDNGSVERVLWFDNDLTYVIDINSNNFPYQRKTEELRKGIIDGKAALMPDDPYMTIFREEELSLKYKDKRDKAWSMIKDIASDEPLIFHGKYRRRHIKEVAQNNSVSELCILNYIKRYWKMGKTPNALIPFYQKCGGKGKERLPKDCKRGRPRENKEINGIGINVTEEIKKIFVKAINRFYYTAAKNSLVRTYEQMRKEYFNDGYREVNGVQIPILKQQAEIPSFPQFRYWFEKERNIKKEIETRFSKKKYLKDYRAIPGQGDNNILQPGTYEIDSQLGDIYLVSRFNRNWIVGRPIITVLVDKFSRGIAGVYVSIENASYGTTMMAIYNAISNKVDFCKQYGIEISHEEWPIEGLPTKIVADRGELEGYGVSNLINSINIEVQILPSYRGDLKPYVEKFHSLLNEAIKPHLPGIIKSNNRERGDIDYRINASLDIYQFNQIVIKAVLYFNNNCILESYKRNDAMISDNVPSISREIYKWGIVHHGMLRNVPDEILKIALMPSSDATVTEKGIKFKDMYYVSKKMLQDLSLVRARQKTWKVKICYNPRDLTCIYVKGERPGEIEKCTLTDVNSRYSDKIIEEVENLLLAEKNERASMQDADAQAKAQLITEIESIVKEAKEINQREAKDNISNTQRLKNIRENRRVEKSINRVDETFQVEERKTANESHIDESNISVENTIDLLLLHQKEGLLYDQ